MAKITRPNVPEQPTRQRQLGPAPVQGALAEAQANAQLGQAISSVSDKYLQDSIKSLQDSQYNTAITQAQLEFNRASTQRMQQQVDENGNPTFTTMVDDVAAIGEEVKNAAAANITDPEVLARFNKDFSGVVANRQLKAFDASRQQHVQFTRASISDTIQATTEIALEDDPAVTEQYVTQVEDVIAEGLRSGALSPEEAQRLRSSTVENIRGGVLSNQINQDARGMLEVLQQDPSALGITDKTRDALVRQAEAGVRDEEKRAKAEADAAQKKLTETQNLNKGELELALIKGTAGEADIEKAFASQAIDAEQRLTLLKQQARIEQKEGKKRRDQQKIEDSIKNGSALFGMTAGQINDHYVNKVDSLSAEGPISLQEKAKLVKDYTVPVNAFAKEFGFGVTQGSLEEASALISSFDFLTAHRSLTLSKLSSDEMAVISRASEISLNTTVGDREALRLARDEVLNRTPEQKEELNRQFNAIEEFQPTRIQDTIKNMFDIDAFTFIVDIPFTEEELGRDVVPALTALYRNAYSQTGSVDAAINMVRANTAGLFGTSDMGAEEIFMLLPPEQVYKGVPRETLKEDLINSLETVTFPEGVPVDKKGFNALLPDFLTDDEFVSPEDVMLESDTITRDNVQNPSWGLYFFREDGSKVYLQDPATGEPIRWSFDLGTFQQKQELERAFAAEEAETEARAERERKVREQDATQMIRDRMQFP